MGPIQDPQSHRADAPATTATYHLARVFESRTHRGFMWASGHLRSGWNVSGCQQLSRRLEDTRRRPVIEGVLTTETEETF